MEALALESMTKAARLAGLEIQACVCKQEAKAFETKSNTTDLVTETDLKCQQVICAQLSKDFPQHLIIGEESEENKPLSLAPTFIIDPVDGTSNFFRNIPHCAVLISHAVNGEVTAALVLDPVQRELFTAIKGEGAHFSRLTEDLLPTGPRIKMSCNTEITTLHEAYVLSDLGYQRERAEVLKFQQLEYKLLCEHRVRTLRLLGSTGLGLAWVALGRADVYVQNEGPYIWDFAGGALLVREAGGVALGIDGNELDLQSARSILAACNAGIAALVAQCV